MKTFAIIIKRGFFVCLLTVAAAVCSLTFTTTAHAWTVTGSDLSDTEQQVAQLLLDGGLDEMHTAAIMGNIKQESGFNADLLQIAHDCLAPTSYANCSGGHGLFQLEADDRFEALNVKATEMNTVWQDVNAQVAYMFSEVDYIFNTFSSSYYVYAEHGWPSDYDGIRGVGFYMSFNDWCATDDLEWAVRSFEQIYHGASLPRMSNRISYAESYYKILMANKPLIEDGVHGETTVSTISGTKILMRYAGEGRYDTSSLINADVAAAGTYNGVIIASGANGKFADALCASGLSSVLDFPIVLVDGSADALSTSTRDTIVSLVGTDKSNIIILGGKNTVSENLRYALSVYDSDGDAVRISGDDRYETSQAIYNYGASNGGWSTGYAMVAKGNDFPDALGAASFCAANRSAMLLIDANSTSLDNYVIDAARVTNEVVIVGGSTSVSESKADVLRGYATVERIDGGNRYATNVRLAQWQLEHGMDVGILGIATGASFPDALGSSSLLSLTNSVLLLVSPNESENSGLYTFVDDCSTNIYIVKIFGGTTAVTATTQAALEDILRVRS